MVTPLKLYGGKIMKNDWYDEEEELAYEYTDLDWEYLESIQNPKEVFDEN